ncbi:prolyl oligopeptidase family serine peptidase [Pseudoalteromonas piscicida]|uniref:prolyl oligopeptidase family serine peptidase n=1 Tax=Pseudoalteromonas piscicida TaxID=43662 RepID=UPI0027E48CD5|nr:prolyl oligopeptidase family serine peptidase [Pseudoalteromonas piscicida]WMO16766.1 prolyl oligopeptidase family serine peptidase [Pseudoalteromonas piscicida]
MIKKILAGAIALALVGCVNTENEQSNNAALTQSVKYPITKTGTVIDNYFGTQVADPYRWLEDDKNAETAAWVKAQNETTQAYLSQIPYRKDIEKRLTELLDYERVSQPFKHGNYTYFYKNDGLQNQSVLYRQKEGGEAEVFLDPNTMSDDGTTSLAGLSFSKDASLVAYQISEGGSDWRKVIVLNAETKEQVGETLVDVKFSGISWFGNEGFYYSSYDKPKGSELSAKTDQHKVYYHKIGTPQDQDKVIFGATDAQKHRYVYGGVTDDKKYLVISAAVSTSGNKLFIRDLSKPNSDWVTILDHTNSDTSVIHSEGDTLFLSTNLDAPNRRIVKVNAKQPQPEKWQDVIPETDNVLSVSTGSGYLFATYIKDAISLVKQYDFKGKLIRDIALPGVGTVSGFSGEEEDKVLYYSFTNYNTPRSIFAFDAESGRSELYSSDKVDFDSDAYVSKQVFYTSKDGTRVPMIITHKKGLKLDGNNPTLLYGYGGFNVSLKPYFSPTRAAWLELGGVYAVANLRGGGEYGKKWHKAGTQMQKQNVFDDFIAAGEYLVSENYTSSEKLAINGGSNGGLLVGATMLQRPDLFKVAVPAVGVLDMLRYHTFTAGAGWAYDYGTAEDNKEMFEYLKGYSPVHNVKAGVNYPATMITTGDHDDRVVPAHSYKFAAELQSKHTGANPTLIRIETNAGHGAGTPISKTIEQYADIYGFTLYNMGIKSL